jgi:hypothetical protein
MCASWRQADLAEALEDELYRLREQRRRERRLSQSRDSITSTTGRPYGQGLAAQVLRQGSDEPQFDLTPATEKAIAWLASLPSAASSAPNRAC